MVAHLARVLAFLLALDFCILISHKNHGSLKLDSKTFALLTLCYGATYSVQRLLAIGTTLEVKINPDPS